MYFTVYKTTNKINSKFYIGKHQTKDLNDGYLGSGKLLKRAIDKHGVENFTKEILHTFDNEQDMNAKEAELVIISEETYNLCEGGKGGFAYINREGLNTQGCKKGYDAFIKKYGKEILQKPMSEEQKKHLSELWKKRYKEGHKNPMQGKTRSEEWKKEHSKKMKGRIPWNKGKKYKKSR